jgi:DNA-binding XRE family transcriptional regulator
MAIAAHLEEQTDTGKARQPRRTLRLETHGFAASAGATSVLVHNVSATGLLLESTVALDTGERIEIDLPLAGPSPGRVVWASGQLFGCQFDAPISTATLSAAQLRSAVEPELGIAPSMEALDDEPFGARLQRLRKARKLTLADIAGQLGVSKPTVWAWEQGKARPVDSRMETLAAALGVQRAELTPGELGSSLRELIGRSRDQIAGAVGVSPDKVRIMIEL